MPRLYSRTDAGRRAWDTQNSLVPLDCRRVLGFVERDAAPNHVGVKQSLEDLRAGREKTQARDLT